MILLFSLLFDAVIAATPHHPITLHDCNLVKFDLNDLDNALHMYKMCNSLSSALDEEGRSIYLQSLRSKMDTACLGLILSCGVNINDWTRHKRSSRANSIRKQKLYKIMNYLTDGSALSNASVMNKDSDMDSRVRWGLIHTIQERVDAVHKRLSQRSATLKRSPDVSSNVEPTVDSEESTTTCDPSTNTISANSEYSASGPAPSSHFSAEFVVGNMGFIVLIVFGVSAVCCFISLLLCKVCCLTDCSIAAIHWWSKEKQQRRENGKKHRKKNKKSKKQVKDSPSSE